MSCFDALTLACEGWFDKPLCDLPDALRQRIEDDFWPMPWDRLTDPAMEPDRQRSWDHSERMISITTQITEWEAVATPTALDLAQKEARLAKLRQELAGIESEAFVDGGLRESPGNPFQAPKRNIGDEHPPAPADRNPAVKPPGSTVRREARRLDTEALHKQWQKAYRDAKKAHPNMTDSWYSKQIAKTPIAKKRSAETIRKNMKS